MAISYQVHAPYHFVPLSKWVYMPDWAHMVSHDVPFKDGYSGVIEYRLTNATPLLVGGEQDNKDGQPTLVKWTRDPHGNPVIPGSSLKGMIRNVLEIAAFGKFVAIDENHFSFRDVSSKSHYLESIIKPNSVRAAWLKYDSTKQGWTLTTCEWAKIKHSDIRTAFAIKIDNNDAATAKYDAWPLTKPVNMKVISKTGKQGTVNWAVDLDKGNSSGNLVFCNKRIIGRGHPQDYEFSYCFYGQQHVAAIDMEQLNALANKMFVSHDEDQVKYLLENQHPDFGIPIFALFDKKGQKLHSLGLSKMPRVLYNHSVAGLADKMQTKARTSPHYFDMAELMFGTLREKGLSLKSRVFFSDGKLEKSTGMTVSDNVTLNSPKATFQAAYLEQPIQGQYQDYDNSSARLSGWKRYVANSEFKANKSSSGNTNVQTQLELLNPNSEFTGRIIFHNLKQEELGALLWAIRLGRDEQAADHYHGLGHGKSLGAGAVQLAIEKTTLSLNNTAAEQPDPQQLIECFIAHMNANYPEGNVANWEGSPQIRHLLALANIKANQGRDLSYLEFGDYKGIKNRKEALPAVNINDTPLNRKESLRFASDGSLSFAAGRLSVLFSGEDKADTWYQEEKTKQQKLQRHIDWLKEEKEKEKAVALEAEKLAALPEDEKMVTELKLALEKANDLEEKRNINTRVEEIIDLSLRQDISTPAARLLLETVTDKSLCAYLAITNKKKLQSRKAKLADLVTKYNLKGGL
ncbi:hypothetical protein ABT56_22130 [Photobacterium aquae]|uniref:CRISPR type III-associated protein domain-containing protein n=1 Tax=Photobacterium aquae TaxID=1195763 RepID=A0A0J1GNV7_9GAMM|nr:TIGR03986 family CRISPR-associated RAMP protein [Photobacterium aquae]KLV01458.1 hypothetical protein ABT56_22130 [Photobacterium aquae]